MKIGTKDRRVIRAFTERIALEGHKLHTDGRSISGYWMGGRDIAVWKGGKIHFRDLGGLVEQTIHRAIRREAAPNDVASRDPSRAAPGLRKGKLYRRRSDGYVFRVESASLAKGGAFLRCVDASRIMGWYSSREIAKAFTPVSSARRSQRRR